MTPKFIRVQGDIVRLDYISDIYYDEGYQKTVITLSNSTNRLFPGDVRDEIWQLMKLALAPKPADSEDLVKPTDTEEPVGQQQKRTPREPAVLKMEWDEFVPQAFTKEHPTQPLIDIDGVVKFQRNAIVTTLLNGGPFNLNQLNCMNFSNEDRRQFAQLIGYNKDAYDELSYVQEQ
jgi:hypothetical protein